MPDEAARDLRNEQHRSAPRRQFARTHACERAARTLAADRLAALQLAPITRDRIPIIALHVLTRAGEHDTAERVRGRRIAADKTVGIPIDMQAPMRRDRRTFRIVDARIESE